MTLQTLKNELRNLKLSLKDVWPFALTISLAVVVLLFAYGCESKTKSLLNPESKVTRDVYRSEIDYLLTKAAIGERDLDRQDEIKTLIFKQTLLYAEGGAINPFGVITTLLSILGIGAIGDDVRLRKQRKRQPTLDKTDQQ